MKKFFICGSISLIIFTACGGNKTAETTNTNDSIANDTLVYEGIFALASSNGQDANDSVRLELYADSTYSFYSSVDKGARKGTYILSDSLLTTIGGPMDTTYYRVYPDSVVALDSNRQPLVSGMPATLKMVK